MRIRVKKPKRQPHCTTLESNYLTEFMWVVSELGDIATSMLVNAHRFSGGIDPKSVDKHIAELIGRLRQMQGRYRQQYRQTKFDIER